MQQRKVILRIYLLLPFLAAGILNTGVIQLKNETAQPAGIGLLIPDNKSIAAKQGAELAIRKANESGGLNGKPFKLIAHSMEGPWGTGSRKAIDLIFEEKVWAILGSHDGRNAHLVEQAATKTGVVFVSAWASDPTLSQAFIPWFFNCVPNDFQQAEALIEEICINRKVGKVVVLFDEEYDSKCALNNFLMKSKLFLNAEPLLIHLESTDRFADYLPEKIDLTDIGCILLFCRPSLSLKIFLKLREEKIELPVFGPLFLLNEDILSLHELKYYDNSLLVPSGNWSGSNYSAFYSEYRATYGTPPGMVASYSFDGMSLLIEAIRKAGSPDREKIQEALSRICYEGITGTIQFDSKGNRSGRYYPGYINNGIPASINTELESK